MPMYATVMIPLIHHSNEDVIYTWLTALLLGFLLHKSAAFQDALALHYGWLPLHTPTHCACETSFLLNILYLVLKVGYLLFDTMK